MRRLRDIVIIAALSLAGALLVGGCTQNVKGPAEDVGSWLRVERVALLGGYRLWVACDTTTGNLLYLMAGDGRAVWVIPGGCQ